MGVEKYIRYLGTFLEIEVYVCEIAASQAPSFSHGIAEQGLSTQSTSMLDLKMLGSCFEWINIARLPTLRFFMQPKRKNAVSIFRILIVIFKKYTLFHLKKIKPINTHP